MSEGGEFARRTEAMLAAWVNREPRASSLCALLVAQRGSTGSIARLRVSGVLAVPGPLDARYRGAELGSLEPYGPADERAALAALESFARERAASFEVFAYVSRVGYETDTSEWISRRGPSPIVAWTVAWEGRFVRPDGTRVEHNEDRVVRAATVATAHEIARAERFAAGLTDRGADGLFLARESAWVRESDEAPRVRDHAPRPPLIALTAHALREALVDDEAPTVTIDRMGTADALACMSALSLAWDVALEHLGAAGAYVRGDLARDEADLALHRAADRSRSDRLFTARVRRAIRLDVASPELARNGRSNPIRTLKALRDVLDLSLGEAKALMGAIDDLGAQLSEPGALSRVIAQERRR